MWTFPCLIQAWVSPEDDCRNWFVSSWINRAKYLLCHSDFSGDDQDQDPNADRSIASSCWTVRLLAFPGEEIDRQRIKPDANPSRPTQVSRDWRTCSRFSLVSRLCQASFPLAQRSSRTLVSDRTDLLSWESDPVHSLWISVPLEWFDRISPVETSVDDRSSNGSVQSVQHRVLHQIIGWHRCDNDQFQRWTSGLSLVTITIPDRPTDHHGRISLAVHECQYFDETFPHRLHCLQLLSLVEWTRDVRE